MSTPAPNQETVSHYRLIERLGTGAMGEVWLAEDTQLPRKVAVKLLPRHLAEEREAVDRLLREARAAAYMLLPACYEMLGRAADEERANQLFADRIVETLRRHPDNIHARSLLAGMLVRSGEVEAAKEQLQRCIDAGSDDGRIRYNIACAYARAGLREEAIEQLREGVRHIPSYLADWPRNDPDLAALRDHPEFIRMFSKADRPGAGQAAP